MGNFNIKNKSTIKRTQPVFIEPDPIKPAPKKIKTWRKEELKVKNELPQKEPEQIIKVALVCIAKNEDNYIKEWVDYHKLIGFDHIFIYQNDWRCSLNRPDITKIEFDGPARQIEAYNDFIQNQSEGYDWVSFLDVDEFLVLNVHANVKEFIKDYADFESIGVNWKLFGDSGLTNVIDDNYNVLSRFKMTQTGVNLHIKTITKLGNPDLRMDGVHAPNVPVVDTNKEIITGEDSQVNENGDDNIAQINHYFCKTREEYGDKIVKGRANSLSPRNYEQFDVHNANDEEDLSVFIYLLKNLIGEDLS